jgi:hypothetical protein
MCSACPFFMVVLYSLCFMSKRLFKVNRLIRKEEEEEEECPLLALFFHDSYPSASCRNASLKSIGSYLSWT